MAFEEFSYQSAIEQSDPTQVFAIEEKTGPVDELTRFVNLRSLNLTGNPNVTDFSFLKKLPHLEKLYLGDLGLSEIPGEVEEIKGLTTLFLGNNPIQDFSLLTRLPNLIDLSLEGCGLKKIPEAVLAIKGLEVLGLYGNTITSITSIKALPQLRELYLGSNKLKKIPRELLKLKNLRLLDIFGNYSLDDPGVLYELTQLETLGVSNARGDKVVGPGLYDLTNLRDLMVHLYWDESTDLLEGLEGIGALEKLEKLTINGANIKRLPDSIRKLTSLKELTISDKGLEDISALREMPALEKLNLDQCSITTVPEGFSTLKNLKEIKLSHNKPLTDIPGLRDLPELEYLECFNKQTIITDTLGSLRALKTLRIGGAHWDITVLSAMENLEELFLDKLPFENLPENLVDLKHLTIWGGELVSADDMYLTKLPALEHLSVSKSSFRLPELGHLKTLEVSVSGSDLDLDALKGMPDLQELHLHRTDALKELPTSITAVKGLQKVTLEFFRELSDISALRDLPALREFKGSYLFKLPSIPPSFSTLQALEQVTLISCKVLTDISSLGELPRLKTLDFSSLDELESLPASFKGLEQLEKVKLRRMPALKDISVLAGLPRLKTLDAEYCKALTRSAIAAVENAIATGDQSDDAPELKMSYEHFIATGEYKKLSGKEDGKRTYGFPLWFATPDVLRSAIEDFSWTEDYRYDEESEEAAVLTDPESDLVPLAILDFGWEGCDASAIDAYAEEIFLVDRVNAKNPVFIWGHDGRPSLIHPTFDDFLANLRAFGPETAEVFEAPDNEVARTYLEFIEGTSSKFWQVVVEGNTHTVTYGKIGTPGQSKTKTFADATAAQNDANKLIKSKQKKGYT